MHYVPPEALFRSKNLNFLIHPDKLTPDFTLSNCFFVVHNSPAIQHKWKKAYCNKRIYNVAALASFLNDHSHC